MEMEIEDVNQKIKSVIEATLFYGDSYCKNEDVNNKIDDTTLEYNVCQKVEPEKILNYKIHKIICKLVSNKYIASLKLIYKDRNNGEEITLLETPSEGNNLVELDPFEFSEQEEIISIRVWVENNKRLLGFEIKTNKGNTKKFGYGDNNNLIKIDELESNDKIVVGFGVYHSKTDGVTGLFCYYINKKLHCTILSLGMLYLRNKIKNKTLSVDVTKEEDEQMYTLKKVCGLADVIFFEIAKYASDK